jgi:hypothetical protein
MLLGSSSLKKGISTLDIKRGSWKQKSMLYTHGVTSSSLVPPTTNPNQPQYTPPDRRNPSGPPNSDPLLVVPPVFWFFPGCPQSTPKVHTKFNWFVKLTCRRSNDESAARSRRNLKLFCSFVPVGILASKNHFHRLP